MGKDTGVLPILQCLRADESERWGHFCRPPPSTELGSRMQGSQASLPNACLNVFILSGPLWHPKGNPNSVFLSR